MLRDPWLTNALLNSRGDDFKPQKLPAWFTKWLQQYPQDKKWVPKEFTESGGVKGVVVTPDYDGDCMIRCFLMGAFESFPHRIVDLVTLLTTPPCRLPTHDRLATSHAWCVSAVAARGGAARIAQAIAEGDIGWWARGGQEVDWALHVLLRTQLGCGGGR
jgi:hypothetical protein